MAIKGIFFDNQVVNAKDFGAFASAYGDVFLGNHQYSINNNSLTIPSGYLVVGGRLIQFDGNQNISLAPSVTNGYGRIVLTIDLTRASTESTFSQITLTTEYASTINGFNDLTQSDINLSGSIYQKDIIYFNVANGVCSINDASKNLSIPLLTNIVEAPHSFNSIKSGTLALRSTTNYGSANPSGTPEEGTLYFKIV